MSQKFAAYNAQGAIFGYYDSIDSPVPAGVNAIEITEAQWQACIATTGYAVANGALVAPVPPTTAQLLAAAQAAQLVTLSSACAAAIVSGFTSSALGSPYTYPSKMTDQQNLASSITASLLAFRKATSWAPDTVFEAGTLVDAGGQVYACVAGGPSGAAAPAWPTAAGEIVNDGGAQWQLWTTAFWCATQPAAPNEPVWAWVQHTALQIQQVGEDGMAAILSLQAKNALLGAEVEGAMTVAEAQAIVWS